MDRYIYQLSTRHDGKYYARIYQHGIPGAIDTADDCDTEEEAIEAAEEIIRDHRAMTNDL